MRDRECNNTCMQTAHAKAYPGKAERTAIDDSFSDILSKLAGTEKKGNEYSAYCPSCENGKTSGDRHLYLRAENGKILLSCKKECSADAICFALAMTAADLFENPEKQQQWEYIREHIYYDIRGDTAAKKTIYRKPGGDKTGIWYRYEHGQYIKGLDGYKPPVYNLPLISAAGTGTCIYIAEGEKDADTLCRMGYLATTTPNGAGQAKIPDECMEYFRDRCIVIIGDNDEPGRKYALMLYNALRKTSRQTVKIDPSALMHDLPEKGDLSDICQMIGEEETRFRLAAAVSEAFDADLYSRPYIYRDKGDGREKVSPPSLHEYIRKHEHYFFARSAVKGGVQRYIYRSGVYRHISDDEFKGIIRDYLPVSLYSTRTVNEVFSLFSMDADRFVHTDELDSDENIINFRNGILCLGTMKLVPHSPEYFSTLQIPVVYNAESPKPKNSVFEKFINHLTDNDPDSRQLILEFMGAAISNVAGYRMKKALFMYGPGNTGKSQCKELLIKLLGTELFSGIDLDALEERFGTAQLYGKRLAGSSDMGYITIKGLRVIKLLTGGDNLFAEYKGENSFNFKFKGILWFCANRLPRFGGDKGDHVYDRIMILPCRNVVAKPDPALLEKMYAEKEYIVRICAEAVQRLISSGYKYTEPACALIEMKKYRVDNDSVLKFLEECTVPCSQYVSSDKYTTGQVYKIYNRWSHVHYDFAENRDTFRSTLKENGKGDERLLHGNKHYTAFVPTVQAALEYNSYSSG